MAILTSLSSRALATPLRRLQNKLQNPKYFHSREEIGDRAPNMESPTSNLVARDFQVTGVSRSGRVRKKSSKLLDFESPEEIEKRTRRQSTSRQPARYTSRGRPPNILRDAELDQEMLLFEHNVSENETTLAPGPAPAAAAVILNSDDELDNLVQDLVDGVQAEATNNNETSPSVRQSLYMREKANKRKVVTAKVQRKDKGKQRYTAYSLWARDVRKRELQDMDSANATRRLSELWANVSNREKNGWRRKAKVQATLARSREKTGPNSSSTPTTAHQQPTSNGSTALEPAHNETTFQNRATTSRTRKLAADRQQSSLESTAAAAATASTSQRRSISTRSGRGNGSAQVEADVASGSSSKTAAQQLEAPPQPTSIEPIDAAAHLKLLGESLTVIGERLKKHNGHVALSGSLSVLLDSLLCSMGPLLCMTTQIPGLENKAQLSRNLANTLDNIAYVMPGL